MQVKTHLWVVYWKGNQSFVSQVPDCVTRTQSFETNRRTYCSLMQRLGQVTEGFFINYFISWFNQSTMNFNTSSFSGSLCNS
jgi:hypothetical protein